MLIRHSAGDRLFSSLMHWTSQTNWLCLLFSTAIFLTACEKSESQTGPQASPPAAGTASSASPVSMNSRYPLGSVVRFGIGGGSERFRESGWSDTEKDATWTIGDSAKLRFA